jgi:hypothetical protein
MGPLIDAWRDWECFKAMEKVLGPFQGARLSNNVEDLANVDLVHQQGLTSCLSRAQQCPHLFKTRFSIEEGEEGEGIEDLWRLRVCGHRVAPSGGRR